MKALLLSAVLSSLLAASGPPTRECIPFHSRDVSCTDATTLPAYEVYRLFLSHFSFLESTAEELDSQGLPGHELRGHYRKAIGLSEREDAILRDFAREWKQSMSREEQITAEFVREYQEEFRASDLDKAEIIAVIQARAAVLKKRRVALMLQHLEILSRDLGPEAAAKLDKHVKEAFALNLSVTPITSQTTETNPKEAL
jgi:hypothetical protein